MGRRKPQRQRSLRRLCRKGFREMAGKKTAFKTDMLKKFPFFAPFPAERLMEISGTAPRIAKQAGEVVFRRGDRSTTMYLILKGEVQIEREDAKGEVVSVGRLSAHQIFGELAMLSRKPRQATVTVTKDAEFMTLDRRMMLDIIRKSEPEEIIEVFSALSDQMRAAYDREFNETLSRRTLEAQMEVEKQRALTQLVAGVAHEINTPLGVINTAVSVMARELAEPQEMTAQRAADIAESLELMRRNVERAHRLVQEFKKVSIGQLMDEKETFDISEAIRETVNLVMVGLKQHQIQISFHDKLTPAQRKWTGYRGFLSQILINLLTNADRYAYPNATGGLVDVRIEMEGDRRYRLTVADYGKGISEEDQARIFEPFFTTGRTVGGTGLGLAIVHNLVKNAMKGEIGCKSAAEKGTTFEIILPREIPM